MLIGLLAGVASAVCFGAAAVAQASSIRGLDDQADSFLWFIKYAWREPLFMAVIAAYLAGFVLHAIAIWLTPLYLAQATISLSLPITAWVAARHLDERLGWGGWLAISSIAAGLVLLAVSAGAAGDATATAPFVITLWIGVGALGLFGWLGRDGNAILLATAAGLGYAGSALAVRGISGTDLLSVLAAVALPVYGALAFWLYSVALNRTGAAIASGSVIVYQTLVPSIVGLVWLGDSIRPGWLAGVIVGLALAIVGALALSRRDPLVG